MADSLIEEAEAQTSQKITRRNFLRKATFVTATAAIGLAGYSGLIEVNEVDVSKIDFKVQRLATAFDGFKIALLADLHFGPYTGKREISAAVREVNALNADVVALLGDFVSESLLGSDKSGAKKAEPCAELLSGLRSRLGSFAVLGNHDYNTDPEFVADALRAYGLHLLRNANHPVEENGGRLWLLGVNDVIFHAAQLENVLAKVPSSETKILLAHEPDFADESSRYGIDIQFSGHSHGGQIRCPGLRPAWLPPLARKYYDGYYRVNGLQLYTNRGIGTVGVPFRFMAPPEVTLVTLRAA
jgi:predicted MPP superfamily phosphohydrolase